jgi:hypothetical protein
VQRRDQVIVVGDRWDQGAEVSGEADQHGRDGTGLDDEKQGPAVEKSPERGERLAQVDVLPTGARHHRRQLPVRQRADDGEESGHNPRAEQPARAADQPRHVGGDDEDSRPDHRAHDDHRRVVEAEAPIELRVQTGIERSVGHQGLLN